MSLCWEKNLIWQLEEYLFSFFKSHLWIWICYCNFPAPKSSAIRASLEHRESIIWLHAVCRKQRTPSGSWPWRPNIPLGLLAPWSLHKEALAASVSCHTQNWLSLNTRSYSQGQLHISQMQGRRLPSSEISYGWAVRAASSRAPRQHRFLMQPRGCRPSPLAAKMSAGLLPAAEVLPLRVGPDGCFVTLSRLNSFSHPQLTLASALTAHTFALILNLFVELDSCPRAGLFLLRCQLLHAMTTGQTLTAKVISYTDSRKHHLPFKEWLPNEIYFFL